MKYSETQMNKYVNKLMELVYTTEEMKNGLITESNKTNSKRVPLDLERFNLIKSIKLLSLKNQNYFSLIFTLLFNSRCNHQ